MKPNVALLLLVCLSVPFSGAYLWLHLQQWQTKKEVKRLFLSSMDREELVFLTFARADAETELRWKEDREFIFQGQLYDVVERAEVGDTLQFWCWWDHAEGRVEAQLDELLAQTAGKDPQRQERQQRLRHFFQTLQQPPVSPDCPVWEPGKKALFSPCEPWLNLFADAPPSPPPRTA